MAYVDIVNALALLQFVWFGIQVGRARARYGVKAPAVGGHEIFERHFRVQQNTLELLVILVPALYLFSRYVSAPWGAALGSVYLAGRQVYAAAYTRDPAKRGLGFALSMLPTLALIGGGIVGAILAAVRGGTH